MASLVLDGIVTQHQDILHDSHAIAAWVRELAEAIGMHCVGGPVVQEYPHWPGSGAPSVVQFLEESDITIHTFPQDNMIWIDLCSCKPIPDPGLVAKTIIEKLGLQVRHARYDAERNWKALVQAPSDPSQWPDFVRGLVPLRE